MCWCRHHGGMNRSNTPITVAATRHPAHACRVGWAVCSGQVPVDHPVAALSLELAASNDGWYHLLPAGYFSAKDGRPADVPGGQWFLDAATAAALIARNAQLAGDRPVDYEHQTLNSEKNGQPAPAAGRFNASELQWREGSGLWIKPRWTPRAQRYLDDREYIYLSAVFPYDATTGQPLWIHSVALTNDPGLDGLHPLTSLKAGSLIPQQEKTMDPLLMAILKALGIQVVEEKKPEETEVMAALKAIQDKAALSDGLATQIAVLKATPATGKPDPAKYVPIAAMQDLQQQVAVLKANVDNNEMADLIKQATADGRLLASMKEWAEELAASNPAVLKGYLDKAAPIAALKGTQTQGKEAPAAKDQDGLTAEDMAVLKATGLDREAYLKAKGELQA